MITTHSVSSQHTMNVLPGKKSIWSHGMGQDSRRRHEDQAAQEAKPTRRQPRMEEVRLSLAQLRLVYAVSTAVTEKQLFRKERKLTGIRFGWRRNWRRAEAQDLPATTNSAVVCIHVHIFSSKVISQHQYRYRIRGGWTCLVYCILKSTTVGN